MPAVGILAALRGDSSKPDREGDSAGPRKILHVFPYDPRHLGQGFDDWAESQLERWPLAAVSRSRYAPRSSIHVVGPGTKRVAAPPLEIREHRSLASGPRYRDWGDDWSLGLGRTLARLGAQDVCVIHLNDYPAARLAQRAARRGRIVLVFHGRGLGRFDSHVATADRIVVLRQDAAAELRARGAREEQVVVMPPSVDRARFFPADEPGPRDAPARLGFVGRLEGSKGVLEVPRVLARLAAEGIDARAELVGAFDRAQRAALDAAGTRAGIGERIYVVGQLPGTELARRMREWRLLLLPSYTEGFPLVALEACASRLHVAAVAGVLPAELEVRPAVAVGPRERFPELVAAILREGVRPPPDEWVLSHEAAAREWDVLVDSLRGWRAARLPRISRLRRARRFRPPRRLARALLHRRTPA